MMQATLFAYPFFIVKVGASKLADMNCIVCVFTVSFVICRED